MSSSRTVHRQPSSPSCPSFPPSIWPVIFAGLCASLLGIGLARFAYTPLLPVLIQSGWFAGADAVYLGAANLAGYLLGAMLGRKLAQRIGDVASLRLMMLLVSVAFAACAFPLSVAWFFVWRLLSGIAGGAIMVLVAATVLPQVPEKRKGVASGAVFLGVGLGIAASGTAVPLLLEFGLRETWLGLAALSAILTAASWFAWPDAQAAAAAGVAANLQASPVARKAQVALVYAEYALMAVGLVPPMVFLVDFAARGLNAGHALGSLYWILYGVGAIIGPPAYGFCADRLGARSAVRLLLLLQVLALAGLAAADNHILIGLLTLIVGSFPPGIVPMVLAWIRQLCAGDAAAQNAVWSRATMVFAAAQALSAYAFSAIFNVYGGNHRLLFAMGGIAIAIALALDYLVPLWRRHLEKIATPA